VTAPTRDLRARYGPWAVVAGASEGLGAAFARRLAAGGLSLVVVARRQGLLEELARELSSDYGVEVLPVALDLGLPDAAATLLERLRDLEVGLLIYNAALSPIGPFLDQALDEKLRALDLNCRTPLALVHALGRAMRSRGRGGILLMSSMSGLQGSPWISSYAATKAFDLVLAEGLWEELGAEGIDVLACCAGATRTPGYEASAAGAAATQGSRLAPAVMEPEDVVEEALAALGNAPSLVPGRGNRLAGLLMSRLLPRRMAIRIMGKSTRTLDAP
jgi:short-subunit dehydrogenase